MSIIFFDGFDHYTTSGFGSGGRKWNQGSNVHNVLTGRFGGNCMQSGGGSAFDTAWAGVHKTFATDYPSIILGTAIKFDSLTAIHPFIMFADDNTIQCSVWIDPDTSEIILKEGRGISITDNTLATTGFVPPLNLWFYLEIEIAIGNPGSVEFRINGTTFGAASGIQTQQSGSPTLNKFHCCAMGQFGPYWYTDDLYVLDPNDATGNVTFLGEVRVQTKYPDADGFQTDFFRSSGLVNSNNANATPTNYVETGLYNYSGTVGAKDLYSIGNFTVSGTIFAVQENLSFRKDDVGNREICPLLRTASTEFEGTAVPCYSDYTHTAKIWEENPVLSTPWTLTDLNLAEFGIKIKS